MNRDVYTQQNLPDTPGVYFFKRGGEILYIGKATSLRDRVRSYFGADLTRSRSPLIAQMVEEADVVDWQETDTVLEALILEANLIKDYQPPYNTREKDNKSFNYVVITDEEFPRVVTIRGRELEKIRAEKEQGYDHGSIPENSTAVGNIVRRHGIKKLFGPFIHGGALREALKIIRKLFPYRDAKCRINTGRPCFNRQIGLCPGTCTDTVTKREYANIVRNITLFFEGRKGKLLEKLEREMNEHAEQQEFERAEEKRRTIWGLTHINDIALIKREAQSIDLGRTYRIEAYDVAHFAQQDEVGVMTVVENGEVNTDEYRKFRIRDRQTAGDTAALREILERRLAHHEWPYPALIVVDGGAAQLNTAHRVIEKAGLFIPIVAVTKDEYHRPREIKGNYEIIEKHERDILLANNEAHRFALTYHRKQRRRGMTGR